MTGLTISQAIVYAFRSALTKHRHANICWEKIALDIGSKLPHSTLHVQIQWLGELDVILREMESERVLSLNNSHPSTFEFFANKYTHHFTEIWICSAYEVFRLLKQRKLDSGEEFKLLEFQLRLIRISLDKSEIAKQFKQSVEIDMLTFPDKKDVFHYSSDDLLRSHILPMRICTRSGSTGWYVTDVITDKENHSSYWLDRQDISDRILALWDPDDVSPSAPAP